MGHGYDRCRSLRVETHSARAPPHTQRLPIARPSSAILSLKHNFIYTNRRDHCDHNFPPAHTPTSFLESVVVQGTPRIAPGGLDRKNRVPTGNPQAGTSILSGALKPLPPPLRCTAAPRHQRRPLSPSHYTPTSAVLVPPDPPNPSSASLILPRHRAVLYLLIFSLPLHVRQAPAPPPRRTTSWRRHIIVDSRRPSAPGLAAVEYSYRPANHPR